MKLALIGLAVLALGAQADEAKTTLEFNNIVIRSFKKKDVKVDVRAMNNTLKRKGLSGLPVKLKVNDNAGAFWAKLRKDFDAAAKSYKRPLTWLVDRGQIHDYPEICYRGKASDVPAIVKAMSGTFFHKHQSILAIRHGKESIAYVDQFKTEKTAREYYMDNADMEVEAWADFDTKSKDVLMMSDLGQDGDGTELYATTIEPCP